MIRDRSILVVLIFFFTVGLGTISCLALRPFLYDGARHIFNLYEYQSCSWLPEFDSQARVANCLFQLPTLLLLKINESLLPLTFVYFFLLSLHLLVVLALVTLWRLKRQITSGLLVLITTVMIYLPGGTNLLGAANEGIPFVVALWFLLFRSPHRELTAWQGLAIGGCVLFLTFSHQSFVFVMTVFLLLSWIDQRSWRLIFVMLSSCIALILRALQGSYEDPAAASSAMSFLKNSWMHVVDLTPSFFTLSLIPFGILTLFLVISSSIDCDAIKGQIGIIFGLMFIGALMYFSRISLIDWLEQSSGSRVLVAPLLGLMTFVYWWFQRRNINLKSKEGCAILLALIVFQIVFASKEIDFLRHLSRHNQAVFEFARQAGPGCHYLDTSKWEFNIGRDTAVPFLTLFESNQKTVDRLVYVRNETGVLRPPLFDPCQAKSRFAILYGYFEPSQDYWKLGSLDKKEPFHFLPLALIGTGLQ